MSIQPTKRSMFVRHNWKLVERVTCLSLETESETPETLSKTLFQHEPLDVQLNIQMHHKDS